MSAEEDSLIPLDQTPATNKEQDTHLSKHIRSDTYALYKQLKNELLPIEDTVEVLPNLWKPWCLTFSPDGHYLAVGCYNGTIRLYDGSSFRLIRILERHESEVNSISYAPNGKTLASGGSSDGTVRIWDMHKGECLHIITEDMRVVESVCYAPDGETLAAGSGDDTVRIWDANTGECLRILKGHEYWVNSVCYAPDGKTLASGDSNGTARVWDALTGECLHILKEHKDIEENESVITRVYYKTDSKTLFSKSLRGGTHVWDTETGECINILKKDEEYESGICYSPDRKIFASWGKVDGPTISICNSQSGHPMHVINGHVNRILSLCYAPNGKSIASGSSGGFNRLLDANTGENLNILKGNEHQIRVCLSYTPDSKSLALESGNALYNTICILHIQSERSSSFNVLEGNKATIHSIKGTSCFSADNKKIALLWDFENINIIDTSTGKSSTILKGHQGWVRCICYAPDDKSLASGGVDQTVRIWDIQTEKCLRILRGHESHVTSVSYAPDGKTLASASYDKTIRIWNAEVGECLKILNQSNDRRMYVCFSPDGKSLASYGIEGSIEVWDSHTGENLRKLDAHKTRVNTVCFSPDGRTLASGNSDGTIKFWDVATGKLLRTTFADGDLWCTLTPGGYYTGSKNCEELLIFRDKKTGCVTPARKYRAHFYKPEKIRLNDESK